MVAALSGMEFGPSIHCTRELGGRLGCAARTGHLLAIRLGVICLIPAAVVGMDYRVVEPCSTHLRLTRAKLVGPLVSEFGFLTGFTYHELLFNY